MGFTPAKSVKGFITNTATQKTVKFQYNPVMLETILESVYDDQDNKNLVPYQEWQGGKQQINFPLQFKHTPNFNASGAVVTLRTFAQPTVKNGKFKEPPTCLLHIGSGEWKVKIRKVHVTYTKWHPNGSAAEFDVVIETSEFKKVPKPPEEKKEKTTSTKTEKPKEPEERPYAYLMNQQK